MIHQARLLHDGMAAVKNSEVGNSAHIEAGGQLRITLSIHLDHDCSSRHIRCSSRNFGSCHAARAAPGCPKIDQHRDSSLLDDLVEQLRIYFQRLSSGTQWSFAGSAASGICKMAGGDAVLAPACLAGSKEGMSTSCQTFQLDPYRRALYACAGEPAVMRPSENPSARIRASRTLWVS